MNQQPHSEKLKDLEIKIEDIQKELIDSGHPTRLLEDGNLEILASDGQFSDPQYIIRVVKLSPEQVNLMQSFNHINTNNNIRFATPLADFITVDNCQCKCLAEINSVIQKLPDYYALILPDPAFMFESFGQYEDRPFPRTKDDVKIYPDTTQAEVRELLMSFYSGSNFPLNSDQAELSNEINTPEVLDEILKAYERMKKEDLLEVPRNLVHSTLLLWQQIKKPNPLHAQLALPLYWIGARGTRLEQAAAQFFNIIKKTPVVKNRFGNRNFESKKHLNFFKFRQDLLSLLSESFTQTDISNQVESLTLELNVETLEKMYVKVLKRMQEIGIDALDYRSLQPNFFQSAGVYFKNESGKRTTMEEDNVPDIVLTDPKNMNVGQKHFGAACVLANLLKVGVTKDMIGVSNQNGLTAKFVSPDEKTQLFNTLLQGHLTKIEQGHLSGEQLNTQEVEQEKQAFLFCLFQRLIGEFIDAVCDYVREMTPFKARQVYHQQNQLRILTTVKALKEVYNNLLEFKTEA
ncbi:MAG: hypothetical protein OHK0017_11170 [Patescibacteria group bacterium]